MSFHGLGLRLQGPFPPACQGRCQTADAIFFPSGFARFAVHPWSPFHWQARWKERLKHSLLLQAPGDNGRPLPNGFFLLPDAEKAHSLCSRSSGRSWG